jgi:hypothetical protein
MDKEEKIFEKNKGVVIVMVGRDFHLVLVLQPNTTKTPGWVDVWKKRWEDRIEPMLQYAMVLCIFWCMSILLATMASSTYWKDGECLRRYFSPFRCMNPITMLVDKHCIPCVFAMSRY